MVIVLGRFGVVLVGRHGVTTPGSRLCCCVVALYLQVECPRKRFQVDD